MNSRPHGSEGALAKLKYSRIKRKYGLRFLIGGLGMGYAMAAGAQSGLQENPDCTIP
jgi:hypothetical protein